ncbi:hypothetical protein BGX38DRAFT_1265586 [Terfezia claveryi]|nr:hypothetical protein BGX38DRAFT_1265586 [Terfezia claveryi]
MMGKVPRDRWVIISELELTMAEVYPRSKYVDRGVGALLDDALLPYKKALAANWHRGWGALMRSDHLSTRTFMSQEQRIVPRVDRSGDVQIQTEEGLV